MASALALTPAELIFVAPNVFNCVNGSLAPKNLPRAFAIPPTNVPIPVIAVDAPPMAIALENAAIASAVLLTPSASIVLPASPNSLSRSSGPLTPSRLPNASKPAPTRLLTALITPPAPIAVKPTPIADIPKPVFSKASPSSSVNPFKESANGPIVLLNIHCAPAIPAPIATIAAAKNPAPFTTTGPMLPNAAKPAAAPFITPSVMPPRKPPIFFPSLAPIVFSAPPAPPAPGGPPPPPAAPVNPLAILPVTAPKSALPPKNNAIAAAIFPHGRFLAPSTNLSVIFPHISSITLLIPPSCSPSWPNVVVRSASNFLRLALAAANAAASPLAKASREAFFSLKISSSSFPIFSDGLNAFIILSNQPLKVSNVRFRPPVLRKSTMPFIPLTNFGARSFANVPMVSAISPSGAKISFN